MRLCLGTALEDSSSKSAIQSKDNVLKTWLTEAKDIKPICKIEHAGCASRTMCIENKGRPARQKEEGVGAVDKNTGASWDYKGRLDLCIWQRLKSKQDKHGASWGVSTKSKCNEYKTMQIDRLSASNGEKGGHGKWEGIVGGDLFQTRGRVMKTSASRRI
jgi:hypothetical protein